jgi:hypothetical protein
MNIILNSIQRDVDRLVQEGTDLINNLEKFGWKDERPEKLKKQKWQDILGNLEGSDKGTYSSPQVKIPTNFIVQYHKWYSGCLAIVDINMNIRIKELNSAHTRIDQQLNSEYINQQEQYTLARNINQIIAIISSLPAYVEGRLYDIELKVAQIYVGDQLTEAETLFKVKHVRAAGAIAGVLLERHLRLLCDRQQSPLKYNKSDGITKLNDILWKANVYDQSTWRKVQWMGDVRNTCDHAKEEPKPNDVKDLIAEVKKFIALFVV